MRGTGGPFRLQLDRWGRSGNSWHGTCIQWLLSVDQPGTQRQVPEELGLATKNSGGGLWVLPTECGQARSWLPSQGPAQGRGRGRGRIESSRGEEESSKDSIKVVHQRNYMFVARVRTQTATVISYSLDKWTWEGINLKRKRRLM